MISKKREHLIRTAQKLFYLYGFKATGIDKILAESGVAKKTLYNHFESKDELIIATLQRRDEQVMSFLREAIPRLAIQQPSAPQYKRLLALFDALCEWVEDGNFNGCMFINASAEYPRSSDPVHAACTNHKRLVIQFIEELLADMKLDDSYMVAKQMAILIDGAIVNAHTCNDRQAAKQSKVMAITLMNSYTN